MWYIEMQRPDKSFFWVTCNSFELLKDGSLFADVIHEDIDGHGQPAVEYSAMNGHLSKLNNLINHFIIDKIKPDN